MAQHYDENQPTTEERYGRATESKRLQVDVNHVGDVDMLIAAGWISESLGTKLWRVRREWDMAHGDYLRAKNNVANAWDVAAKLRVRGRQALPADASEEAQQARAKAAALAVAVMNDAERAALTARALILVVMKSLHPARQAVGAFALQLAARRAYTADTLTVLAIAGRALELYVDPQCPNCRGLGVLGGHGGPLQICPSCHGTRRRTVRLGQDAKAEDFGRELGAHLERKTDYVEGRMRAFRFTRDKADRGDAAAIAELQKRLGELRSTKAQDD